MFAHPLNSEAASKKQMAMPLIAQASPLLITSTQRCNNNNAVCRRNNTISPILAEDYNEDVLEPIEVSASYYTVQLIVLTQTAAVS